MEIIVLEKIANLGDLGDRIHVKPGYARNYLVPQGKAVVATAEKIKEFEAQRAELEKLAEEKLLAAQSRGDDLRELEIIIYHRVGEEGKLFGSVGTKNIAEAIVKAGVQVDKHELRMPTGVIRQAGTYNIDIQLHADVVVTVTINVVADDD